MLNDLLSQETIKILAVAGAVVLFGWQWIVDAAKSGWNAVPKRVPLPTINGNQDLSDMRTVLELASRLKAAGCSEGVDLCQQLIDVMLNSKTKK